MINKYSYNQETRSFNIWDTINKATELKGTYDSTNNMITRFKVIGIVNNQVISKLIVGGTAISAVQKVKKSNPHGTKFRAFRIPQSKDAALDYEDDLKYSLK